MAARKEFLRGVTLAAGLAGTTAAGLDAYNVVHDTTLPFYPIPEGLVIAATSSVDTKNMLAQDLTSLEAQWLKERGRSVEEIFRDELVSPRASMTPEEKRWRLTPEKWNKVLAERATTLFRGKWGERRRGHNGSPEIRSVVSDMNKWNSWFQHKWGFTNAQILELIKAVCSGIIYKDAAGVEHVFNYRILLGLMGKEMPVPGKSANPDKLFGPLQLVRADARAVKIDWELTKNNAEVYFEVAARRLAWYYEHYGRWDMALQAHHSSDDAVDRQLRAQSGGRITREDLRETGLLARILPIEGSSVVGMNKGALSYVLDTALLAPIVEQGMAGKLQIKTLPYPEQWK